MIGRMIYVGSMNKNAMPRDYEEYENVRRYIFPLPGEHFHYGHDSRIPEKSTTNLPYGLLTIDDIHWNFMDYIDTNGEQHFSTRVEDGKARCFDIEQRMGKWGVVLIQGNEPTEEEIQKGKDRRRKFLEERVIEISENYANAKMGKQGFKLFINEKEKACYSELGKVAPNALDAIENAAAAPAAMKDCPFCAEPIRLNALFCRYCNHDLTDPEPKRGPGRPRKEETVSA